MEKEMLEWIENGWHLAVILKRTCTGVGEKAGLCSETWKPHVLQWEPVITGSQLQCRYKQRMQDAYFRAHSEFSFSYLTLEPCFTWAALWFQWTSGRHKSMVPPCSFTMCFTPVISGLSWGLSLLRNCRAYLQNQHMSGSTLVAGHMSWQTHFTLFFPFMDSPEK